MSLFRASLILLMAAVSAAGGQWDVRIREAEKLEAARNFSGAEKTLLAALGEAGNPRRRAIAYNALGALYQQMGKTSETEASFRSAIRLWEESVGPRDPGLCRILNNLTAFYLDQKRYSLAEKMCRRSLEIQTATQKAAGHDAARLLGNLGAILDAQANYAEGESAYRQALDIFEKRLGPEHMEVAAVLHNLAILYEHAGRRADAIRSMERALQIWERASAFQRGLAVVLMNLGHLYAKERRWADAERAMNRGLDLAGKHLEPDHPVMADLLLMHADLLRKTKRPAEAKREEARARAIGGTPRRTVDFSELLHSR